MTMQISNTIQITISLNTNKISYLKSKISPVQTLLFSIQYSRNVNDVGNYIGSSGSIDLLSNIVIG